MDATTGAASMRRFASEVDKTDRSVRGLGAGFSRLQAGLITANQTFALLGRTLAAAERLFNSTLGAAVQRADKLMGLSRAAQVSAAGLSRLEYAAQQAGVSLDALAPSFRVLNANLANLDKKGNDTAKVFRALGIDGKRLAADLQSDPARAVVTLAKGFDQFEDGARKAQAAQAVFGRGYGDWLRLLAEGPAALEANIKASDRFGRSLSSSAIDGLDRLGDSIDAAKASLAGFTDRIFSDERLVAALGDAFESIAEGIAAVDPNAIRSIADSVAQLANAAAQLDPSRIVNFFKRVALGAGTGAVAGVFGGPFGILGSALIGGGIAAVGDAAITQVERNVAVNRATGVTARPAALADPALANAFSASDLAALRAYGIDAPAKRRTLGDLGLGSGGGGEDKAAKDREDFLRQMTALQREVDVLTGKLTEQEKEVLDLADSFGANAAAARPLIERYVKLKHESEANKKAAEELARAQERAADMHREIADELAILTGAATENEIRFRGMREEALKLGDVSLLPMIDELERTTRVVEVFGQAWGFVDNAIQDTFAGLILGTRSAADALDGLKASLASTFAQLVSDQLKTVALQGVLGVVNSSPGLQRFLGVPQGSGGSTTSLLASLATSPAITGGGGTLASLVGGGGTNVGTGVPTLGIPGLAYQALFGGATAGINATSATQLYNLSMLSTGVQAPVPAASGAASGLSTATGVAGLLIALGLGAKGIADTRSGYSKATLGTSSGNALTAVQASILAGTTAIGAGIGAAAGTAAAPGFGTVIGAGVGAAVGAAISDAVGKSVLAGISDGVKRGMTQDQLESRIEDELSSNAILLALGGPAHLLSSKVFGPLVAPDIEEIFQKVFRRMLGADGQGLDTRGGVTRNGGLPDLAGPGRTAARLLAQLAGISGDASRIGGYSDILLSGVAAQARRTGANPDDVLADAFRAAGSNRFFRQLRAAEGRATYPSDFAFIAQQYQTSGPFAVDTGLLADIARERGVPNGKSVRRSREAFTTALGASVGSPNPVLAFAQSIVGSVQSRFLEQAGNALAKSPVGEQFASLFGLDKETRKKVKKSTDPSEIFGLILDDFTADVENLGQILAQPGLANGLKKLNDEVFRLGVNASIAAGDVSGARAQIESRLQPFVALRDAATSSARGFGDRINDAIASASGNPFDPRRVLRAQVVAAEAREDFLAFTGGLTPEQVRSVTRGVSDGIRNPDGSILDAAIDLNHNLNDPAFVARLIELQNTAADTRLAALETELSMVSQMASYFEQVKLNARAVGDAVDISRRGPRAVRAIFERDQAELSALIPSALKGDVEAINKLQAGLPGLLQTGESILGPGSLTFRELQDFVTKVSSQLGEAAAEAERIAKQRKDELIKQLGAEESSIVGLLTGLGNVAEGALLSEMQKITAALGKEGEVAKLLASIAQGLGIVTPAATGGFTNAGQPRLVGELGPELFIPAYDGRIVPNDRLGGGDTFNFNPTINIDSHGAMTPLEVERAADAITEALRTKTGRYLRTELKRAVQS